ncbi:MAG: hydroxymethylglutaryl-CoA lyase [Xanthomonadales bacterium]|nr:hydroxymethylglutaryl-CoA lyase [Xanthomonadales bacterium]
MNTARDTVRIVEVGPRDGLQNEAREVPTDTKIALIQRLAACGHSEVEATSFVSPKWIPQLADAESVMAGLARREGVRYPVLVPNEQGLDRAVAAGAQDIAVFTAASSAFTRKNINCDVDQSLQRIARVMDRARDHGLSVRGYVSTVLGCPYQGVVPIKDVVQVARVLHELGCREISLGDTIGVGTPHKARAMLEACASEVPMAQLAVHFHDTYGQALANVFACIEAGVRVVDASVAGLGGCPYAQGASGNLASEDLVYLLNGLGIETGVDLDALCDTARWINTELGREPVSKLARIENARRFRA